MNDKLITEAYQLYGHHRKLTQSTIEEFMESDDYQMYIDWASELINSESFLKTD